MPYSALTKDIIKKKKALLKEMENAWNSEITYAVNELYEEAWKMYDSFIDQYYLYKTKSYIRHGETKPGTCRGINLYRGQQFKIINKTKTRKFTRKAGKKAKVNLEVTLEFPRLITKISAKSENGLNMEGYRHNTPDEVLDMVINGIRGVPQNGWWEPWMGSYNGKYFSTGNTTMVRAFELFEANLSHMALNIMLESRKK